MRLSLAILLLISVSFAVGIPRGFVRRHDTQYNGYNTNDLEKTQFDNESEEIKTGDGIHLLLAAPQGVCEGVVRAIDTVETALKLWGAPIYVKHEIVHNRVVCDNLRVCI